MSLATGAQLQSQSTGEGQRQGHLCGASIQDKHDVRTVDPSIGKVLTEGIMAYQHLPPA
jgi:hypothetical protein